MRHTGFLALFGLVVTVGCTQDTQGLGNSDPGRFTPGARQRPEPGVLGGPGPVTPPSLGPTPPPDQPPPQTQQKLVAPTLQPLGGCADVARALRDRAVAAMNEELSANLERALKEHRQICRPARSRSPSRAHRRPPRRRRPPLLPAPRIPTTAAVLPSAPP